MTTRTLLRAALDFWSAMIWLLLFEFVFSLIMVHYMDLDQLPDDSSTHVKVVVLMLFNVLFSVIYTGEEKQRREL